MGVYVCVYKDSKKIVLLSKFLDLDIYVFIFKKIG